MNYETHKYINREYRKMFGSTWIDYADDWFWPVVGVIGIITFIAW